MLVSKQYYRTTCLSTWDLISHTGTKDQFLSKNGLFVNTWPITNLKFRAKIATGKVAKVHIWIQNIGRKCDMIEFIHQAKSTTATGWGLSTWTPCSLHVIYIVINKTFFLQPPDYWASRYWSQGRGHGFCGAKRTKDHVSKGDGELKIPCSAICICLPS